MTYAISEASAQDGQPVELYRFALQAQRWMFASGQSPVTYQSETWPPAPITRSGLEQAHEINRNGLEIRVPRDNPVAALFIASPPEGVVSVTLYRMHTGDPDNDFITLWKGRVLAARFSGSEATLRCEPVATSLKRVGLRARYQLLCRHVLYSAGCGALKDSFRVDGTVAAVSGAAAQVAAAGTRPDGYFVAGVLQTDGGARMIVGHAGANLDLIAPLPGLAVGQAVQLYAGCDHGTAQCAGRFGNLANFGGFPFIPLKNPFSGDAIV
jgi:uncharacterized phage protein (TIGR02218 family)